MLGIDAALFALPHVEPSYDDEVRRPRRERRLSYGTVQINYFPMGLSDNPAVSCGVAVGLEGPAVLCEVLDVEDHRPMNQRRRPVRWLEPTKRREILSEEGVDDAAVEECRKSIVKAQKSRIRNLPPLHMIEQMPWFVARSVRRGLRRREITPASGSFFSSLSRALTPTRPSQASGRCRRSRPGGRTRASWASTSRNRPRWPRSRNRPRRGRRRPAAAATTTSASGACRCASA